jgi:hypothetical protein
MARLSVQPMTQYSMAFTPLSQCQYRFSAATIVFLTQNFIGACRLVVSGCAVFNRATELRDKINLSGKGWY